MEEVTRKEDRLIRRGVCPDCGLQLYEGPHGGNSVNVGCVNGHKFNAMPMLTQRLTPDPDIT